MAKIDIQAEVQAVNLALKADCHRVAIQVRGKKLSLVATLPPRPGTTRRKPHQQRISLKLGATLAGLRRAKVKAILLSDQLDRDKFAWEDWIDIPTDEPEIKTCGYWIERFKAHIWPNLPEPKETAWKKQYLYFGFNRLPLDKSLTPEVLITAVLTKAEKSKSARDKTVMQLQRLAKFADVDIDLSPYKVNYAPSDVVPKDIPTDEEIQQIIDEFNNTQWRYVFGLMATYGLRNHEAFQCHLEDMDGITVAMIPDGTKTGARIAYPHPTEWVERWLSGDRILPTVNPKTNEVYGRRCSQKWRLYKAPGTPYNLRHAYAIRCHAAGVTIAVAANWMGHRPDVHLQTYQRWISQTVSRTEWEKLNHADRDVD